MRMFLLRLHTWQSAELLGVVYLKINTMIKVWLLIKYAKHFNALKKIYMRLTFRMNTIAGDINGEITYVQAMGRAKNWGNRSQKAGCCGGLFCTPRGNLYACECKKVKLGTIFDPQNVYYGHYEGGYCSQSEEYKTEVLHVGEQETVKM